MYRIKINNPKGYITDLLPSCNKICFVISTAFKKDRVDALLHRAQEIGFSDANDKYPNSYRNNSRLQIDDLNLANNLLDHISTDIPSSIQVHGEEMKLYSLNERLRYCKYENGEQFKVHQDGIYQPTMTIKSALTFLLYLNDGDNYGGGATVFYSDRNGKNEICRYKGNAGDVLVFEHDIWHCGLPVESGQKFILRSDFVYEAIKAKQIKEMHHDGYIWDVISLPNQQVATASRDKSIKIWSKGGRLTSKLDCHENSVLSLCYEQGNLFGVSRDGFMSIWKSSDDYSLAGRVDTLHPTVLSVSVIFNKVLTTGSDGFMRLWTSHGSLIGERRLSEGWIWDLANLPGGKVICCTSLGEVIEVDVFNGFSSRSLYRDHASIRCLCLNGETLWVGLEDGRLKGLNLETASVDFSKRAHDGIVRGVMATKNYVFCCGEDGKVIALDKHKERSIELFEHENFATALALQGEHTLVSVSYSGKVEITDISCLQSNLQDF